MKKFICTVKDGCIILPRDYALPEKFRFMAPGLRWELKLYTETGIDRLFESPSLAGDDKIHIALRRYIMSRVHELDVENGVIRIPAVLDVLPAEGSAEMLVDDDEITVQLLTE